LESVRLNGDNDSVGRRRWRHEPVPWQQRQLSRDLREHYAYYGIMGNYQALNNFHRQATREWRKWLQEIRTFGSVGGPAGQTAGSTRFGK
jgi:hypothetical protein